jgi:hypothetical protein
MTLQGPRGGPPYLVLIMVLVIIGMCILFGKPQPTTENTMVSEDVPNWVSDKSYRIRWNPAIPKAIVEQFTLLRRGRGVGWHELEEFRSLEKANEYLDRLLIDIEAAKKVNSQWKIVREEN